MVVATPLGNLSDITPRAVDALRGADLVVCEDTRRTRGLLTHLGIRTPTRSHHRFNEAASLGRLLELLEEGRALALVSDAGTPGVSDPGSRLVEAARSRGIAVEAIPGPSAPAAAISASGFEASGYLFAGFPPPRGPSRRRFLKAVREMEKARAGADPRSQPWPLVFFEAPHRLEGSLADMIGELGDRPALLCREMTKLHEEAVGGRLSEILEAIRQGRTRGEMTLVVAGEGAGPPSAPAPGDLHGSYRELIAQGVERHEALRRLASSTGLSRREIYRVLFLEEDRSED